MPKVVWSNQLLKKKNLKKKEEKLQQKQLTMNKKIIETKNISNIIKTLL